jgi:hypothetical protein
MAPNNNKFPVCNCKIYVLKKKAIIPMNRDKLDNIKTLFIILEQNILASKILGKINLIEQIYHVTN